MMLIIAGACNGVCVCVCGRYDRTVTAMTDSDLCYLERRDMPELMRKFPVLEAQLKQFAGMRDRSVFTFNFIFCILRLHNLHNLHTVQKKPL